MPSSSLASQQGLLACCAWLDDELPSKYNAMVMTVCMAWNRLLTYPVPRKDAKEF
jgi:hypothetical protein